MTGNEKILNENFVLVDWVQILANSREFESIGNLLKRINKMVANSMLIENQIEALLTEKTFKLDQTTYKLDKIEEISFEESCKYIEMHKSYRESVSDEDKGDMEKTQLIENLETLNNLNSMIFKDSLILSRGMNFKRAFKLLKVGKLEGAKYYKIEPSLKPRNFVILMRITTSEGKVLVDFEVVEKLGQKKKRRYPKQFAQFVRRVEKGKIYNYSKPLTQTNLSLRNLEKEVCEKEVEGVFEVYEKIGFLIEKLGKM